MNILVYGSKGWIGTMLINKWKELYPSYNFIGSETRVSPENINILKSEIVKADRVFCCIGRTSGGNIPNIDYLEDKVNENVKDNLFALVAFSVKIPVKMIVINIQRKMSLIILEVHILW